MSLDILKGLATTFKNMGKKPTTISYPEEERELPPRFRGRHVLHRYENGMERCVGCFLCAGACPADAIYIEAAENTEEQRVSPGERYAKVFDVNMLRCIFCGYCQAACPTGAITLEHQYKLSSYYPEDAIYHKEQLLEPLGQATVGSNPDWFEAPPPQDETRQPVPQESHVFDGSRASATSVGLGTLPTERPILLTNEDQDVDRRAFERDESETSPGGRGKPTPLQEEDQDVDQRAFEQEEDGAGRDHESETSPGGRGKPTPLQEEDQDVDRRAFERDEGGAGRDHESETSPGRRGKPTPLQEEGKQP